MAMHNGVTCRRRQPIPVEACNALPLAPKRPFFLPHSPLGKSPNRGSLKRNYRGCTMPALKVGIGDSWVSWLFGMSRGIAGQGKRIACVGIVQTGFSGLGQTPVFLLR